MVLETPAPGIVNVMEHGIKLYVVINYFRLPMRYEFVDERINRSIGIFVVG